MVSKLIREDVDVATARESVSRRNAFSTILLGGAALAVGGCATDADAGQANLGPEDGRLGQTTQALKSIDVVNIKDYGAVGDGLTDDTAAINAALAAASTTGLHHVFFPAGTYLVTSSLIPPSTEVRLFGADCSSSQLRAGANVDLIDIRWSHFLYIEQLGFLDDRQLQTTTGGIHINNTVNDNQIIRIRDCLFDRTFHGIYNDNVTTHSTAGLQVRDCQMFTRGPAIELFYTQDTIISNVESSNFHQGANVLRDIWLYGHFAAGGGLVLDRVTTNAPAQFGIVIEECLQVWANHIGSDSAGAATLANNPCGILIQNCDQVNISNAWSHNCPNDNMRILGSTRVSLSQCQLAGFSGTGGSALQISNNGSHVSDRISVVNCRLYDYRTTAVHIVNSTNVQIANSSTREFDAASSGGILVENSNNIVLSGNVVLGPPAGGATGSNYGISLVNTQQTSVTGNTVRGFAKGVVESGTSNYNSIMSNVCGFNGGGPADAFVKIGAQTVPSTLLSFNIG